MEASSTTLDSGAVVTGVGGVVYDDDYAAEEHRILTTRRTTSLIDWARKRGPQRTGVTAETLEQAQGLVSSEDWEQIERLLEPVEETYDDWAQADIRRLRSLRAARDAEYRVAVATGARKVGGSQPRGTAAAAAPRERRDSSSSRTSGTDPGDGDPDPPGDCLELVLLDEETAPTQTPRRYCRCERNRPHTAPNWDIGPDNGDCRSCTLQLRPRDVRYWHAVARSERARVEGKGWSL